MKDKKTWDTQEENKQESKQENAQSNTQNTQTNPEDVPKEAQAVEGEVIEQEDPVVIAQAKADEYLERLQRTMADFDNFRKRTVKEKASMYDDGVRDTVEKLLPVIDNFERAVSSKGDADDNFTIGIEMILKQFKEILTSLGVEEIPTEGVKFDPNLHSAVAHEDSDEYGESEIIFVMLKGYRYKEKVIRHSMVKVAN